MSDSPIGWAERGPFGLMLFVHADAAERLPHQGEPTLFDEDGLPVIKMFISRFCIESVLAGDMSSTTIWGVNADEEE